MAALPARIDRPLSVPRSGVVVTGDGRNVSEPFGGSCVAELRKTLARRAGEYPRLVETTEHRKEKRPLQHMQRVRNAGQDLVHFPQGLVGRARSPDQRRCKAEVVPPPAAGGAGVVNGPLGGMSPVVHPSPAVRDSVAKRTPHLREAPVIVDLLQPSNRLLRQ